MQGGGGWGPPGGGPPGGGAPPPYGQGYAPPQQGHAQQQQPGYPAQPPQGHPQQQQQQQGGYPQPQAYPQAGHPQQGYPQQGYPQQGYPQQPQGYGAPPAGGYGAPAPYGQGGPGMSPYGQQPHAFGPAGGNFATNCPRCQSPHLTRPNFTWWGGLLGPKLFNHTVCNGCGLGYNWKTGKSNATAIGIYLGVAFALTIVLIIVRVAAG